MSWDLRTRFAVLLSAAVWIAAAAGHSVPACSAPPHHRFDFVLGNWLVRGTDDRVVGTVTITRAYSGCVLLERWRGAGEAREGLGVIGYLPERGKWHREFLEAGGGILALDGDRDPTAMTLTGRDYSADGIREHRVTWSPRSDGTVVERWETSIDEGRSWQLRFHGVFYRIAE